MSDAIKMPTESEPVTVIEGDCLDVLRRLPAGCVDAVVTSPPYNTLPVSTRVSGLHAERKTGVNRWVEKAANGYADQMPELEYQDWQRSVVGDCLRVSKGLVWVNHKIRYRDGEAVHPVRMYPFPIYSEIVWDRSGSMALNCKRYAPSHEGLWAFGTPHYWDDSFNTEMSVWRLSFDRDPNAHPCAFPLELASRPIRSSVPDGGVVLDPFAGSGTTGVAAILEGRRCILIEKEPKYAEICRRRVAEALGRGPNQLPFDAAERGLFAVA